MSPSTGGSRQEADGLDLAVFDFQSHGVDQAGWAGRSAEPAAVKRAVAKPAAASARPRVCPPPRLTDSATARRGDPSGRYLLVPVIHLVRTLRGGTINGSSLSRARGGG